jgi:hypothetical protein
MTHNEIAMSAVPYSSAAVYYHDSDCVEYVKIDGYCVYERVDAHLTLIKDITGHNLIGFKLKGFGNMFEKLKSHLELSDNHFLALVSVIEKVCTIAGENLLNDEKRKAGYKAAYQLAANDNVLLGEAELAMAA